jgi:hypothetical protein
MECLSEDTNRLLMGFADNRPSGLCPLIKAIEKNKPISEEGDPWGNVMVLHEAIDEVLHFMKVSLNGIGDIENLFHECQSQVFRGAGSIMEILALLHRRLYQHSQFLLMETVKGKEKIKAVSGAKG